MADMKWASRVRRHEFDLNFLCFAEIDTAIVLPGTEYGRQDLLTNAWFEKQIDETGAGNLCLEYQR